MLKDAGANEVKYNLECVDPELFPRVCPGISPQEIVDALEEAVSIFGKNRVFTNIIVGLGESDELLCKSIDELRLRWAPSQSYGPFIAIPCESGRCEWSGPRQSGC